MMNTEEIIDLLRAQKFSTPTEEDSGVARAFASDLMSDVLTLLADQLLLITGLNTIQTIRTAEMADIRHVLLVRGKIPDGRMREIAGEHGIILMSTRFSMFKSSGILYAAGLEAVY